MTTQKELLDWLFDNEICPVEWHLVVDVGESGTAIVFHTEEENS